MVRDPGITPTDAAAGPQHVDKPLTAFEYVSIYGRWNGGQPPIEAGDQRAQAIALKRRCKLQPDPRGVVLRGDEHAAGLWTDEDVELGNCVSGRWLLSQAMAGKAWPYPLGQRGLRMNLPTTANAPRMKLDGVRMALLEWIAVAMVAMDGAGLVATHDELAKLCGRERDVIGIRLHELRSWGLIRQSPTFVQHGKASSRRGNVYRLTRAAGYVFGLPCVQRLPDQETDVVPRKARYSGIARANASEESTSHPESTYDRSDPAAILSSTCARDGATGSEPEVPEPGPVPSGSPDISQPDSAATSCSAGSRLSKPESAGLVRSAAAVADYQRQRPFGADYSSGEIKPPPPSSRRRSPREIWEREQRQRGKLRQQAERALERDRQRMRDADEHPNAPPPVPVDVLEGRAEERRAYRDRLERERAERAPLAPPRPRPEPGESIADMIERITRERWGSVGPVQLAVLAKMRGGDS